MSPRTADPEVAEALIETGARLIAEHEPLTARRLATEIGASTSAVYTHFGSMADLRRAIRRTGFERLAQFQTSYQRSDDPLADLMKQGWAYRTNGIKNPALYRVMFMEAPLDADDAEVGLYTFRMLVDEVQRCIDAGLFTTDDADDIALQSWAASHGIVTLYLAGMLDRDQVNHLSAAMGRALLLAFGADEARLTESFLRASEWVATQEDQP